MSIDAKTQFMKNCVYLARKYNLDFRDFCEFGVFDEDSPIGYSFENNFNRIWNNSKNKSTFMPQYKFAWEISALAGVELFEVFSRSLKRLDELGELPQ